MRSYLEGPRYTLEGYVKRLLYEADGPMPETEIVSRVQEAYGREELDAADLTARVNKALTRLNSPFLQQEEGWGLRTGESNGQLNDRAAEALILASAPQSYGRILEYIGLTTKRSRGDLMSQIDLDGDARFSRLEDGQWVLTEWVLDGSGYPIPVTELPYDSLSVKKASSNDSNQPQQTKEKSSDMLEETKSGSSTVAEDSNLFNQILVELKGYAEQIEQRQQQIPQTVVQLFEQENLAAIEGLMRERKQLASLVEDLQKLVARHQQQDTIFKV